MSEQTKNDLTRRDTSGDSQLRSAASTDAKGSEHGIVRRDIQLLRDTVSTLADFIWTGETHKHLWSIPADRVRDWDCILTDAIDELEHLRAAQEGRQ